MENGVVTHSSALGKTSAIEIYQSPDGETQVQVTFDHATVWLNQEQLGQLFGRDRTVIGRHIRTIFKEVELEESMVCADFAQTTLTSAFLGYSKCIAQNTLNHAVT